MKAILLAAGKLIFSSGDWLLMSGLIQLRITGFYIFPPLAVCTKQVQMDCRPIAFPRSLIMLGAVMHQDLQVQWTSTKNTAILHSWHLYLVFIHANRSVKTTKQSMLMSWTQHREGHFVLVLLSKLLFQRLPNGIWKASANEDGEQLAEHTPTSEHPSGALPGAAASLHCAGWPLPFLPVFFLSLLLAASSTTSPLLSDWAFGTFISLAFFSPHFFLPLSVLYWLI